MSRTRRLLTAGAVAAAVVLGLTHAPTALARVEAFQVQAVHVQGIHFMTYQETLRTASIPRGASVWDDLDPLAERLRAHPLVQTARVSRRFPSTLVLKVEERKPVALIPTPTLVPVDSTGRSLPVDAAVHALDLPLIHPLRRPGRAETRLSPGELRRVAREVGRLLHLDPQLTARISDVRWADGAMVASLSEYRVEVLFNPDMPTRRLREGIAVIEDALARWPDVRPRVVDLRFADQVVVRYGPRARRNYADDA